MFLLIASCPAVMATYGNSNSTAQANSLGKIKHIVVLMLENRSFDNLLGKLYPKSDQFDGLSGEEENVFVNEGISRGIKVWNTLDGQGESTIIPSPNPAELFSDINEQLFGENPPPTNTTPTMSGFVQNYFSSAQSAVPDPIMHYYVPEQVPILSELAKNYAVCDAWFASAPCQTWPNRFFLHTATAGGYENNSPYHFPYEMPTIFTRFNELGRENGWKIYYHDFPQSAVLSDLWAYHDQMQEYSQFKADAASGSLPSYSFIEPRYYAELDFPNDQHPPHDIRFGEELIADVYNTLQSSPTWTSTLLIIIYDEHGGCYDHVAPPKAIPPEAPKSNQVFLFDRYGVRIPAVVISPYIQAGTVFRALPGSQPFDHTSVISTIRRCFDLGEPFTERDRNAPDISSLLTLPDDQLNLGKPLVLPAVDRVPEELAELKASELSDLQKSLHTIAVHLPNWEKADEGIWKEAVKELTQLIDEVLPDELGTCAETSSYVQDKLKAFLAPVKK